MLMLQAIGPLTAHMALHILLMNAVAPLAALAGTKFLPAGSSRFSRLLFPAMIAQLAVLWAWHTPPALVAVMRSETLHLAMQASLLFCATWFWSAVFDVAGDRRWRAILALLLTSKIFCLLGVLLVFAPRALYPAAVSGGAHGALHQAAATTLGDQQLAGLLMLVACPATYVIAGIVIAARWFGGIDETADLRRAEARRAV